MKLETENIIRTKESNGTFFQHKEDCYVFTEFDIKMFLVNIIADVSIKVVRKEGFPINDYINNLFKD